MQYNLTQELFNHYSSALFASSLTTNTISLVLNMLIMGVYLNYAILQTSTNIYIAFGTVSALVLTVLDLLFYSTQAYTRKHVFSESLTCAVEAFMQPALGYFIILSITFVAVQRILAITRGSRFSRAIDRRKACVMFCLSAAYISLVCLAPLYGWYSMRTREMTRFSCYVEFYTEARLAFVYVLARTVLLFVIPFLLMAMCYYIVYSTVKTTAVQRTLKKSQRYNSCSPDLSESTRSKRRSMRTRIEARTVRTVIAVLSVFFGVLSTYEVFAVYLALTEVTLQKLIVYHALWIVWKFFTQIFAMSQVLLNTHFRQHFLFSFCRRYAKSREISSTLCNARTTSNGSSRWSGKHNRLGPPSASYGPPSASSEIHQRCEADTIVAEETKAYSDAHQVVKRSSFISSKTGKASSTEDRSVDMSEQTTVSFNVARGKGPAEKGMFLQVPKLSRNSSSVSHRNILVREHYSKPLLRSNQAKLSLSRSVPCLTQALLSNIILECANQKNFSKSQTLLASVPDTAASIKKDFTAKSLSAFTPAANFSMPHTKQMNHLSHAEIRF